MNINPLRIFLVMFGILLAHTTMAEPDEHQQGNQARSFIEARSFDEEYEAARSLANNGNRTEAISAYTALLNSHPGNTDVLLGRGIVYARVGMWKESESDLLEVTERSPEYLDAWNALANMYSWSDQHNKAIDAYSKLIMLQTTNADAYLARAKEYRNINEFTLAKKDLHLASSLGAATTNEESYIKELEIKSKDSANVIAPSEFSWSASLSSSLSKFTPAKDKWQDSSLSIRHYFTQGSLALEVSKAERFNEKDMAIALDSYVPLWARAYGNLRFQNTSNPKLYPDHSWRIEVYQGVLTGWEISASYDQLAFSADPVKIYSIGVGKYLGNFYLRARHLLVPGATGDSSSERFLARYYLLGDADSYIELNAGFGRDDDPLVISKGQNKRKSIGASLAHFPLNNIGYKAGLSYSQESNNYIERELSAGIYFRWK